MSKYLPIVLLVLLCCVSRLPQLTTPYLHLDGDECVLGLMAQHIESGKEIPFYFWGQNYGFSTVEASLVALSFKVFGVGIFSLKLPMLVLWSIGCIFIYLALSLWTNRIYSFVCSAVLILSPAWMAWSMKARGGYSTAFLLSSILLYVLARYKKGISLKGWFGIGLLVGFVLIAQPIFMVGILPLVIFALIQQRGFKNALVLAIAFTLVFMLAKLMLVVQPNTGFWKPALIKPNDIVQSFNLLPARIEHALTQYSSSRYPVADPISSLVAKIWGVGLLFFLGTQILGLITKQLKSLSLLFGLGVLFILGTTFIFNAEYYADRYLLSLTTFLLLWIAIQSYEWMERYSFVYKLTLGLFGILIVLGLCVSWNYRNFYRFDPRNASEVPEMQKIPKVIEFLNKYQVKHVFSIDDDLAWKLMFFTREDIIARWMNLQARNPFYPLEVDRAFFNNERVAVAGNAVDTKLAFMIVAAEGRTIVLADQYFVHLAPTKELVVNKLRFQVQ